MAADFDTYSSCLGTYSLIESGSRNLLLDKTRLLICSLRGSRECVYNSASEDYVLRSTTGQACGKYTGICVSLISRSACVCH